MGSMGRRRGVERKILSEIQIEATSAESSYLRDTRNPPSGIPRDRIRLEVSEGFRYLSESPATAK